MRCGEEDEVDQGRQIKRGFVLSLEFGKFRGEFPSEGETKTNNCSTPHASLFLSPQFQLRLNMFGIDNAPQNGDVD